jgi:hypothetical protein
MKLVPKNFSTTPSQKIFTAQEEAQRVFDAYPGNPYRLDKDKDGIACESN